MSSAVDRRSQPSYRSLRVARYPSLLGHWMGRWFRAPRSVNPLRAPRVNAGQVAITFGGHATALIRYAGLTLCLDPVASRFVGPVKREIECGISDIDLDRIDVVLISNLEPDHLDLSTLARLPRTATVVVPRGGAARVSPLCFARVVELAAGTDLPLPLGIVSAEAAHYDAQPALSYVLRGDGPSVFCYGDGGWFDGLADIGARQRPDVALLPIGGFSPRSFSHRHMGPLEALAALDELRARMLIPIHHGSFALSYERITEPARIMTRLVRERGLDAHVRLLAPGESEVFVAPQTDRIRTGGGSGDGQPGNRGPQHLAAPALPWDAVPRIIDPGSDVTPNITI